MKIGRPDELVTARAATTASIYQPPPRDCSPNPKPSGNAYGVREIESCRTRVEHPICSFCMLVPLVTDRA